MGDAKASEKTPLTKTHAGDTYRPCCCTIRSRSSATTCTLCILACCIFAKILVYATLPTVLPALRRVTGDESIVTFVPGVGQLAFGLGKASQIFATYTAGGKATITAALILSGVSMVSFSFSGIALVPVCWAVSSFGCAHVWGAATAVVSCWVDEEYMGRAVAIYFGLAAGCGGTLAALLYGRLLDTYPSAWQLPFLISGLSASCVALVALLFLQRSALAVGFQSPRVMGGDAADHPLATTELGDAARHFARSSACWLVFGANFGYRVTWTTLGLFGPLYAVQQLHWTTGVAAQLMVAGLVGGSCGALLAGFLRDSLGGRALLTATALLKLLGMAAATLFIVLDQRSKSSLTPLVTSGLVFVICAVTEYSWSVLIGVFTLRYGGPMHASTLNGIFDVGSTVVSVPVVFLVGSFFETKNGVGVLWVVWISSLFAHVCIITHLWRERRVEMGSSGQAA